MGRKRVISDGPQSSRLDLFVHPAPGPSRGLYEAWLEGRVISRGRTPFLTACRALIREGHDPSTRVAMWMTGSKAPSFVGVLGSYAKWHATDGDRTGTRLVPYVANPFALARDARGNGGPRMDEDD